MWSLIRKSERQDEEDFEDHQIDVFLITEAVQPSRRDNGQESAK